METNEPYYVQQHGRRVRTLPLAEAGYDCYHVVVARRELVRRRFVSQAEDLTTCH